MKLLNDGAITIILTSVLLFISSYIPSIYEVAPTSNPDVVANDINVQYKAIMSANALDKPGVYTIITQEDIEKKTSSIEIQKRALTYLDDMLKDSSYTLGDEDIEKLAVQFQIIYDKAFVPQDIQPRLLKIGTYSLYALLAGCGLKVIVSITEKQRRASVEKRKRER